MSTPPEEHRSWLESDTDGQTPLDRREEEGLKVTFVTTRGDLNAAEVKNIANGLKWAELKLRRVRNVAREPFLCDLHREMFGEVWEWAGTYRDSIKNIGVDPSHIRLELRNLFDDVAAWDEFNSFPIDERAARLHHRLTWIHPFPNGNGRTSRAMADLYLTTRGAKRFTWGEAAGRPAAETRSAYLDAIRAADRHDYGPLMAFVRA